MNYQKLFNYMSEQHGVTLLESDMQEIVNIINESKSFIDDDSEICEICGGCGDDPCSCPDIHEDEDCFEDTIASNCLCGAYRWSVAKNTWIQTSDCIC